VRIATQSHKKSHWAETRTDQEGHFKLEGVSPNPCNLLVMQEHSERDSLPQWTALAIQFHNLHEGETRRGIRLVLTKGGIIRGRAVDAQGNPLHGIDIAFYSAARPRSGAACQSILTAKDGTWAFRFPPGDVYVYIRTTIPEGKWSKKIYNLHIDDGQVIENIDFELNNVVPENSPYRRETAQRAGLHVDLEKNHASSIWADKVTDVKLPFKFTIYTLTPDGKPQPGVKIRCLHPQPERTDPIVDMVVESDTNGLAIFTITKADLLSDWMYWFSLADENYVGNPQVGITPDEESWTFKVLPAEELEFQVICDEKPVSEAKISLQVDHIKGEDWDPKRFRAYAKSHSDSTGRAKMRFVKDMVDIAVAAEGYASKTIRGVQLSGDKPYIIELSEGKEINGQVRDPNNNPMEGVSITAKKEELFHGDDEFILKASTDENGNFTLKNVSPGQWEVSARTDDPAKPHFIAPVKIKVRKWWPVGKIKMAAKEGFRLKGKYVTNYKINTKNNGGLPWIDGFVSKPSRAWIQLQADEDGTFDIWGFPCEGEGSIRFVGMGGYHNFIKMSVEYSHFKIFDERLRFKDVPAGTYENIEVHYLLAGMVKGTVVDAIGRPFPEAEVVIKPGGSIHKTDKQGRFSIRIPPDDNVTLTVRDLRTRAVVFRSEPFKIKEGQVIEKNIKTLYERSS
jgi:protocatechuate 3,4-dioxygenase beta subunit